MEDKLQRLFNRQRQLPQYKQLSDEELKELIRDKVDGSDYLDVGAMFEDKDEKKQAKTLIKKYLQDYTLESVSDKNTLRQLVFLEVFNNRLQKELNVFHKEGQSAPYKIVESLHNNLREISLLKDKLGLSRDKDTATQSDAYQAFELLKKKLLKWGEENQASRTLSCPHCGKMILLKIRTDRWEAQKHPFFRDKLLFSKHLISLYKLGTLSLRDVAKILETSEDYVQWLVEKWKTNPEYNSL